MKTFRALGWVQVFSACLFVALNAVSKPRPSRPPLPGQTVPRYLVLAGNANGGPLVREAARQKFSLYAWDGSSSGGVATPQLLIADLNGYAVRPEGVDLINVGGEWRILFVEDRFVTPGYATRNAVHWPISILGPVQ